jgi:hypothetical protein
MRALEALALPALERLAGSTGEPGLSDPVPAEALRRHTDWLRAHRGRLEWLLEQGRRAANRGSWSERELRGLRALDQAYGGPGGYYLNLYGPPGTFPSVSAADLLAPEEDPGAKGIALPDLRGRVAFVGYQELDIPQQTVDETRLQPGRCGSKLTTSAAASVSVMTVKMMSAAPSAVIRVSRCADARATHARGVPAPTRRRRLSRRL